MKIVQLAGGTSETQDLYVGEERELTVDTSNDELRLHDGATPGGKRIANSDANDARYQFRSIELDGFNFGANLKGWLTRVSPGNYKLRTLTVNGDNLTLTNPQGLLGNPLFSLAPTIESDHVANGTWTFAIAINADGGVIGDVTGNTDGVHTGNVVGDVTGNLLGDASGNHDGSFTGDVDVRGSTLLLDDEQIQLAWLSDAIMQKWIDRGVPYGAVMMWSGAVIDIPESWALCDGNNGTPNLLNRFIVGAGATYAPLAEGGTTTHTHSGSVDSGGAHSHSLTIDAHALTIAEIPSHRHTILGPEVASGEFEFNSVVDAETPIGAESHTGGDTEYSLNGTAGNVADRAGSGLTGGGAGHTHTGAAASSGAHTHTITTGAGSSLPPYFALCYIMKIV